VVVVVGAAVQRGTDRVKAVVAVVVAAAGVPITGCLQPRPLRIRTKIGRAPNGRLVSSADVEINSDKKQKKNA